MTDWLKEALKDGVPAVKIPLGTAWNPAPGEAQKLRLEEPLLTGAGVRSGEEVPELPAFAPASRGGMRVETGEALRAGLTLRELDLAVRRDSRRYDGGICIY